MPADCQVQLEALTSGEPFLAGGLLTYLRVVGRTTADCSHVRVVVHTAGPGSPVLFDGPATVETGDSAPGVELPGLFKASFGVPPLIPLACGVELYVEVHCITDPACSDSASLSIQCKEPPVSTAPPGWPWPWPPSIFCPRTGKTFTFLFLLGLFFVLLGAATVSAPTAAVGLATLALAWITYAIWRNWCSPGPCKTRGALCWCFKRAFLMGVVLSLVFLNARAGLLTVGCGVFAGLLVESLRKAKCDVPSARTPLQQLTIW